MSPVAVVAVLFALWFGLGSSTAFAQEGDPAPGSKPAVAQLELRDLFEAGGVVGVIILALSVAMVALVVEHLISFRRSNMMPPGMAADIHSLIAQQQYAEAQERCKHHPSFLGRVLTSGLAEIGLGYAAIEKSMEDSSQEQSARLYRKIEYLSVIGTLAPMLGLLGTVWGMILAFLEFETKANPQVSELAPGIYKALVTTFLGLSVAVPALASFAIFRNRIDELVAEASLMAEQVFVDYKRAVLSKRNANANRAAAARNQAAQATPQQTVTPQQPGREPIPPVTLQRKGDG